MKFLQIWGFLTILSFPSIIFVNNQGGGVVTVFQSNDLDTKIAGRQTHPLLSNFFMLSSVLSAEQNIAAPAWYNKGSLRIRVPM